ncbi:MAG: ATP-binding cassette domain-containing protein, partial [Vibrio toranzoniae]|uniref:ATP-binding cassette domain-containing protein n=1 Tax=Vibrio toranzoniae TaxID=1194427 RepID=UPI003C52EE71
MTTFNSVKESVQAFTRRDEVFDYLKPDVHPAIDTRHNVLLYVEGVNKSFDGFQAINDLNLYIKEGELRCIIGPNGAGKTTLYSLITRLYNNNSGSIEIYGNNVRSESVKALR